MFRHFKNGNLLCLLVVQVDDGENVPMLTMLQKSHRNRWQHAQVVRNLFVVLITDYLLIGNGEARLAGCVGDRARGRQIQLALRAYFGVVQSPANIADFRLSDRHARDRKHEHCAANTFHEATPPLRRESRVLRRARANKVACCTSWTATIHPLARFPSRLSYCFFTKNYEDLTFPLSCGSTRNRMPRRDRARPRRKGQNRRLC